MNTDNPFTEPFSSAKPGLQPDANRLFPVFLKLENLKLLLVGAGQVGLEKLRAVLNNAPATAITVVASEISPAFRELAGQYPQVLLLERPFEASDLDGHQIILVAINDRLTSRVIRELAAEQGLLANVADTPEQCDFYLGSIVQKGNLKIAISTNGKSPTIAKRIKEQLNDWIPDQIEGVLQNMNTLREGMKGDFAQKVKQLDDLTSVLVAKQSRLEEVPAGPQRKWTRIVWYCLLAFVFMLLGHAILSFVPFGRLLTFIETLPRYVDTRLFLLMVLTGFMAQMVDGSMGMGYGTISTTFLLALGVNPAIVSSRVHSARVFSSGVSGYSHHRFGNINKKLFKALVIPGAIGAVLGAVLAFYGQQYSTYVRIPLSFYTIYLGIHIVRKALKKREPHHHVKRAGWLAAIGGFLDAFAGGGWGALVTGTLIAKRRTARYVIGSVCLAEFFVVFASSVTFFIFLKNIPIAEVAGLILGGLVAAPIAARLVGILPMKTMFVSVGTLVVLTSILTLWKSLSHLPIH